MSLDAAIDDVKHKPGDPDFTPAMLDYLSEYRRFVKACEWFNRNVAAGRSVEHERPRFLKLASKIDRQWVRFTPEERSRMFYRLIDEGYFHPGTGEIYAISGGEILSINGKG